jgi:hypothetical protein
VECPKCAAVQPDNGVECTACGVVFARFREAQERAFLSRNTSSQQMATPPVELERTIPKGAVIVALLVFLVFGIVWTARRRDTRVNANEAATAMLDEINQKGLKQRQRLAAEGGERSAAAQRAGSWEAPVAKGTPPVGFTEADAAAVLNQCAGFNTSEQVLLPKFIGDYTGNSSDELYPALPIAKRDKLVEVKPDPANGRWVVTIPDTAHFRMTIKEDANHHIIPLGRRRVTSVTNLTGTADSAEAKFEFGYEQRVAAELLVQPYTTFTGHATFVKKDGAWKALHATTFNQEYRETRTTKLCP